MLLQVPMLNRVCGKTWRLGLKLIGCTYLLVAVASMVAMALGPRYPLPSPAARFGLGLCTGQPCFRGLTPGLTLWATAQQVFANRTSISVDPNEVEIRAYPSPRRESVGRITIQLPDDGSLSMRDVFVLYGRPCAVTIHPELRRFILRYPAARFSSEHNQDALTANTPIVFVEFSAPAHQTNAGAQPCLERPTTPGLETANRHWLGFTSLERYLAG